MKRFKNILVVNGPAATRGYILERAITLAQRNGAQLTVMDAVAGMRQNILTSVFSASSQKLNELFVLERQKQLAEQLSSTIRNGLHPDVSVVVGTPFIEISRAVLGNKHDLVMMAAEGYEGLRGRFFGSTALHLMRKCPCPVWVMKSAEHKTFAGIMAAVDPDPSDKTKHELNIKIMDLATSLARQEQSALHVVHAWSHWRDHFIPYIEISARQFDQLTRELIMQRRRDLTALVEGYSLKDLDSHVHFLLDEPDSAVPALAARLHIELIVMGTVCRTGLPGLLIGNTAENVLGQVNCSVLAVKPEGFISPIEQKNH